MSKPYFPGQTKERCGCYFPGSVLLWYQKVTPLDAKAKPWFEAVYDCITCGRVTRRVEIESLLNLTKEELLKEGIVVFVKETEVEEFRRIAMEKMRRRLENRVK